ncbi:hypothetical protein [Bacillus andreraoultii]
MIIITIPQNHHFLKNGFVTFSFFVTF